MLCLTNNRGYDEDQMRGNCPGCVSALNCIMKGESELRADRADLERFAFCTGAAVVAVRSLFFAIRGGLSAGTGRGRAHARIQSLWSERLRTDSERGRFRAFP